MAFDWDKFRELAEELRRWPLQDEAAQRSSISRLYYSVYWKARGLLELEDPSFQVPSGKSHKFVWDQFEGKGRTHRIVSLEGIKLSQRRTKADYDAEIRDLGNLVEDAFLIAAKLETYLNQLIAAKAKPS